jgi:hypothetical protein
MCKDRVFSLKVGKVGKVRKLKKLQNTDSRGVKEISNINYFKLPGFSGLLTARSFNNFLHFV